MNDILFNLLLALFLLAANAFYVAAEFALVKCRPYRINTLAKNNQFGARLVQRILRDIEAYLACCQLGITMASLGLGWVGEPAVESVLTPIFAPLGLPASALHLTSFLTGFLLFSSLHIVLGEQVPKTFAIRQPEPVSLWIAYPLFLSYVVFFPLNWLLNWASRATLRLFRVREVGHQEVLSGPEIEGIVEASAEHGSIQEGQAEYIQNVFRFGELEVSDVMVHRTEMLTLCADDKPQDLVNAVIASPVTRIPLWRGQPENIVGILHVKDLLRALHAVDGDASKVDFSALLTPPWFVPETRPVSAQLKAFRRRRTPFALVVDEYGEVEGLVTLEDILEEIVGDITDEHDVAMPGVRRQPDGSISVDGAVPIRDINRVMEWNLPDTEATTIAGLVIHEARSIPEPGQSFTFHGFRFRVLRRSRNRITALRIQPLPRKQTAKMK